MISSCIELLYSQAKYKVINWILCDQGYGTYLGLLDTVMCNASVAGSDMHPSVILLLKSHKSPFKPTVLLSEVLFVHIIELFDHLLLSNTS